MRRPFCLLLGWLFAGMAIAAVPLRAADRPNFVWILSEDNSKHYLKLFDPHGAPAPNIEALARHGLTFDNAFCNAPVCSTARTTLATGCYVPRLFAQYHRKLEPAVLPQGWHLFPYFLRQAGYYTTNNKKKDYNVVEKPGVWDESSREASWRHRPSPDTPFFHMVTYTQSHESSLHFTEQQMRTQPTETDPNSVTLQPYFPDTPLFRYTFARYLDRMKVIDERVGRVVQQLKEDGLLEDTFIFYFGDNGGVLPRSKGYIYESGLNVPLVVRVPENWKQLVPFPLGSRVKGFVCFADFGPTVLHLAGAPVPDYMDGRPFLGPGLTADQVNARDEAFGYADRFDEKYDFCRSLRKGRFKYIRNYQAFYPDALQNNYRYRMLAYQQWRQLYREGRLNPVQCRFFEPKPVEALFDIEKDPHEVHNLADDPAYRSTLLALRSRLVKWEKSLPDLSFYPESYLVEHAASNPIEFGRRHKAEISRLVDVANLALLPFAQAEPRLREALASANRFERYWACIVCSCFGQKARSLVPEVKKRLQDEDRLVRVRAAEFLAIVGAADPRPTLYEVLNTTESPAEALITLNTAVFVNDHLKGFPFDVSKVHLKVKEPWVERRLQYLRGEL